MRTVNYFPVSVQNYNTPKSLDIRMKYGWQGYGIYCALMQKIASVEVRAFALNEIPALAYELHYEESELKTIIENYFDIDDTIFYSNEMNEMLVFYDEKYSRQSEGGKKTAGQLSPEERKMKAKKAINTRWDKSIDKIDIIKPDIQSEETNERTSNDDKNDLNSVDDINRYLERNNTK